MKNTTQTKNEKWFIVFDMIADMHNNEKLNKLLINELFIRGRNEIFLLFLSCNHVLKYQQMLHLTLNNFLLWKTQNESTSTNCVQSFIKYWL